MSGTIDIREEFETEERAEKRKQDLLRLYPPQGYGTILVVIPSTVAGRLDGQKWILKGTRYRSCD